MSPTTVPPRLKIRLQSRKRLKKRRPPIKARVKALVQRVSRASVSVDGAEVGRVGKGLAVLVGVANGDTEKDAEYLIGKITNLRIFADNEQKFNLSALDIKGELLLISQFTLLADTRKGRRPSFESAARPEQAEMLFNYAVGLAKESGLKVETGRFQQHMQVEIHNDGPVTIMLDSREKFGEGN
jgi:D-aminoacyl-tRNA deacylase